MPEPLLWRGEWPTPADLSARIRSVVGLAVEVDDSRRLIEFLRLLEQWAAKFNLISASSRAEIVDRHLLDSLGAIETIGEARSIVDFGSGAGFPGIPLAVVRPRARVFLVESRSHRANFLRQAIRILSLANCQVFEGRGDAFRERGSIDVVVARAVRLDEVVAFANLALAPGGRLIAMAKASERGVDVEGYRTSSRTEYRLPHGRAHVLIELERR